MWSAILGYPDPFLLALVKRLLILLLVGPWLVLLAASAPEVGSWRRRLVRLCILCLLLDQLMIDFQMWGPIVTAVAALWPLVAARRREPTSSPPGSGLSVGAWVVAGLVLTLLAVKLGPLAPVRYAVLLFVTSSLLLVRPRVAPEGADGPVRPPQNRGSLSLKTALGLIAALPLYWSIPEPTRSGFVPLLLAGGLGWIGMQFLCWQARRHTPGRQWPFRAASWVCGLVAGLSLTLLVAESYFRYVFDASDSNGALRTSRRWAERHVRFNSDGYRDREFPPEEELDRWTRIVLLGDSFAYGWGINDRDDMLGPQLERALTGRTSPPPRVFTLAAGGIDTRRETAMFQADGVRLRPRVVVLTYHLNDTEKLVPPLPFMGNGSLALSPLTDNSDFLELFFWHAAIRRAAAGSTVMDLPGMGVYYDPALFGRQSEDLLALIGLIRGIGASPVVVLYPYLNAPAQDGPQRDALDRVAGVFAGAGVPAIDVSRLVNVNDRKYHANPFDPHPSPALHVAVVPKLAEVVLQELERAPAPAPATQAGP